MSSHLGVDADLAVGRCSILLLRVLQGSLHTRRSRLSCIRIALLMHTLILNALDSRNHTLLLPAGHVLNRSRHTLHNRLSPCLAHHLQAIRHPLHVLWILHTLLALHQLITIILIACIFRAYELLLRLHALCL